MNIDEDYSKIEELILKSYEWVNPPRGLSRHKFCRGVHSHTYRWYNIHN